LNLLFALALALGLALLLVNWIGVHQFLLGAARIRIFCCKCGIEIGVIQVFSSDSLCRLDGDITSGNFLLAGLFGLDG
jgi:hypothetical protein